MPLYRRSIDAMGITKDNMRESLPDDTVNNHLGQLDAAFPTLNARSSGAFAPLSPPQPPPHR